MVEADGVAQVCLAVNSAVSSGMGELDTVLRRLDNAMTNSFGPESTEIARRAYKPPFKVVLKGRHPVNYLARRCTRRAWIVVKSLWPLDRPLAATPSPSESESELGSGRIKLAWSCAPLIRSLTLRAWRLETSPGPLRAVSMCVRCC